MQSWLDRHDRAKFSIRDTEVDDVFNALRFKTKAWHGTACVTVDVSSFVFWLDV